MALFIWLNERLRLVREVTLNGFVANDATCGSESNSTANEAAVDSTLPIIFVLQTTQSYTTKYTKSSGINLLLLVDLLTAVDSCSVDL